MRMNINRQKDKLRLCSNDDSLALTKLIGSRRPNSFKTITNSKFRIHINI